MYTACLICGSTKLIPDVPVQDDGPAYAARAHQVVIDRKPGAVLFKDVVHSPLTASICGDCGYVAWFAARPTELYAAYQQVQHSKQDR